MTDAAQITDTGPEAEAPEGDPIEALAREAGWKPQEEWKGDTSKWTDARQYLLAQAKKATARPNPGEREARRIERLEREMESRRLQEVQTARERLESQYDDALAVAYKQGDKQLIAELRAELKAELAKLEPAEEEPDLEDPEQAEAIAEDIAAKWQPAEWDTVQAPWWREHAWVLEPKRAGLGRKVLFDVAAEVNQGMTLEDAFTVVGARLKERYKAMYAKQPESRAPQRQAELEASTERPARKAPPQFGSAARVPVSGQASKLPPEARAQGERFVKQGLFPNLNAYAATYFAELS